MPVNSRDLWLLLKAQDQTNRALNTFTRNVRNAGAQVAMANLQAQKAAQLGAITQNKLNNESRRAEIQQLSYQKALKQTAISQLQAMGASQTLINSGRHQIQLINDEINIRKGAIANTNAHIVAQKRQVEVINENIRTLSAHNRSIQDNEKSLSHLAGRMQSVAQTATAMGFAMSVAGVAAGIGIKHAIDAAIEYDRQVRSTATQVDGFTGNLQELGDVGRALAAKIAVPFEEIQPALFDIFSSMEVGLPQAEQLLKSFSKAAVAGQVGIQDVSRATIGLLNAFQLPVSDVNRLLDIQFQLVQEGIGTYEEWNQRIGLVTPSAVRAGQSIELMMAALATATRMGMSAARSGTSVARSFDALSNPITIRNLKALGVNMLDANGHMRPFNESLRDFRTVLMALPEKDRLTTMLAVFKGAGGTIEARRFLQNVLLGAGNLELFDSVLKETSNSAGSMEHAYTIMAESAAAKTELLRNQWELLKENVGRQLMPAFSKFVGKLGELLDSFNRLDPTIKRNIVYAVLIAAAFAAIVGPLLIVAGAIAAFAAAFAIAGTAILGTMAALLAIVLVIALVGTAFILLYTHSKIFRDMLDDVGSTIGDLKDIALGMAKDIGAAWEEHLAGPLGDVADVLDNKILPAFNKFSEALSGEFMTKIREAARIIADLVEKGFKVIGNIIDTVLVPALEKAGEMWQNNKKYIEPLIPILAQVFKWILIIGAVVIGVLVAAFVGPLVASVLAVIAVFGLSIFIIAKVVQFFKWLWTQIVSIFNGIVEGVKTGWDRLIGFFVTAGKFIGSVAVGFWNNLKAVFFGAWQSIINFFKTAWDGFKQIFTAAMNIIKELWNGFWSTGFGQMIKSGIDMVRALVRLFGTTIIFIFAWALEMIKSMWNAVWTPLAVGFQVVWTLVVGFLKWAWDTIVGLIRTGVAVVWAIMLSYWNGLKSLTIAVWSAISGFLVSIWNTIYGAVAGRVISLWHVVQDAWNSVKNGTISAWNGIVSVVRSAITNVANTVNTIRDKVFGVFSGAASWLFNAGKDIVEGLINGITSKFKAVTDAANKLTGIIKDHMPGSPVKKGPLKILNNGYAGKQIAYMLANGMLQGVDIVRNAATTVANSAAVGATADFTGLGQVTRGPQQANQVVQNFYITTQEIDPRKHSADLGWEMQGVTV